MSQFILSIDQGTTSTRAIVFNTKGEPIATAQQEFKQYFPENGWVEHDPEEIWESTLNVCRKAIEHAQLTAKDILGIGITNQRETSIVWDRHTGQPLYKAIVWQDRRTAARCTELEAAGHKAMIQDKTGLLLDAYFSGTKVAWILDNVEGARVKAEAGELAFGTVDTFLLWRLTGGQSHKTDATNASRTLLFNIHDQAWDNELLELLNVPASMLPEVMDCHAQFGYTQKTLFGEEIPILGIAGDQQAALIGQACFKPGMTKSTYGTGCFLVLNTGADAIKSENQLLTTVGYRLNGEVTYAMEGSIFIAGAAIQWIRDGIKLIQDAKETQALAEQTPADHGVYLVPAFTGLGAPYWDANARGAIFGLTRDSGIKEIVTAGLQSVAYQTQDLISAMTTDGAIADARLRVDGGMVNNDWVAQCLADILRVPVDRPKVIETTALGVAYLAGLEAGVFESLDDISALWQCEKSFEPKLAQSLRDKLYIGWKDAVKRVLTNETR